MEPVHRKARRQQRPRGHRPASHWVPSWAGDSEAAASLVAGRLAAEGVRVVQRGTWAILAASGEADRARGVLRDRGESHNIVESGAEGLGTNGRATLRIAFQAIVVVALVIAIAEVMSRT